LTGDISTVAGNGKCGYSGDKGVATSAELNIPAGVAVDGSGNIYIADQANCRIRVVHQSNGIINTVAGTGTAGYNGDDQVAINAEINLPIGVSLDGYGNIYFADYANQRIREITVSTGIITTVAGTGASGYSGDGELAVNAELNWPEGVTVDLSGNFYIADVGNNRIRRVMDGTITTIGGNGKSGYSGDGGLADSAELNGPVGVAIDKGENVYIADFSNNRIRAVGGALTASTFNPLYKVISILYSPPGNQSAQGYGSSTTNGTTTTIGSSFTFGNTIAFSTGIPDILSSGGSIGNSTTYNQSSAFTESFTDATTITTGDNSSSTFNPSNSNAVNHNLDTFEIWLNPLVTAESNGTTPVSYTINAQPVTVNGVQVPFMDILGVPALTMLSAPAGVTTLNPLGIAGVTTVPINLLAPIAVAQDSGVNAYLPGLGAICANNTLYKEQLAADLAAEADGTNNTTIYCTQANQCGCTPSDFANILQMNPLLNYSSSTHTANPYAGTVSPLQLDSLATSSGAGSGPTICGVNSVPTTANCRYVVVPSPGTNTPETGSENAVPTTVLLEGGIQSPAITITDSTTTTETIGGSTSNSVSVTNGGGPLVASIKVTDTWTWTDNQSVGNAYGSANSMTLTIKSSTGSCDENVSIYEDTVFHTFVFQVPTNITGCP
jgi:hypothetical protein